MSSKKFKKNRNGGSKKKRQLNREGLTALQKCRFFLYLIVLFNILAMFYAPIAHLFGAKEMQVNFGFILLISCQVIVATLHLAKYLTTSEIFLEGREKDYANMYTARARLGVLMQFVVLLVIALNQLEFHSGVLNTLLCIVNVSLVLLALQNITILQRNYV